MSRLHQDHERKIVPRWRSFLSARLLGELDSLSPPTNYFSADQSVVDIRRAEWERHPTPSFAADCLASAVVLQRESEVLDVAQTIFDSRCQLPLSLKHLASKILKPTPQPIALTDTEIQDTNMIAQAHVLKSSLKASPRNALRWIDLARIYESLGQRDPAREAANIALALAPNSRLIIRAVSRMLLHHGRAYDALALLQRHPRLTIDPWLLSANLAIAHITGKITKQVKIARSLLATSQYSPFHVSELHSALATIEAEAGNSKNARKLLTASLKQPTENAIAQAAWLSRNFMLTGLHEELLLQGPSHEARGWQQYAKSEWRECVRSFTYWLADQPFSSRPAIVGSFVAAVLLGEFQTSMEIATLGLRANPNDPTLLNNTAFALANLDKPNEAEKVLGRISRHGASPKDNAVADATLGLVRFRQGRFDDGRGLYLKSIYEFESQRLEAYKALALFYLAQEELRANTIQSIEANRAARSVLDRLSMPEMRELASRLSQS